MLIMDQNNTGKGNCSVLSTYPVEKKMQSLDSIHSAETNVSAFFTKGKTICWKIMKKNLKFKAASKSLGSDWYLEESIFNNLSIRMYASRSKRERHQCCQK